MGRRVRRNRAKGTIVAGAPSPIPEAPPAPAIVEEPLRVGRRQQVKDWWGDSVSWWQKTVTAIVVILTAAFGIHSYFAKEADLVALAGDVEEGRLQFRQQLLKQERTKLKSIPEAEKRQPTSYEKERLEEVDRELKETERRLRDRQKK